MGEEATDDLLLEHAIRRVLYRYCRGVDRRDYALVRTCYHPDATDDHGGFKGGVDGFIDYISVELEAFSQTVHAVANVLVERGPDGVAASEAYATAFHRIPASTRKPERDYTVGFRFVDRFELRGGEWRIASRRIVIDWTRMEESAPFELPESFSLGQPSSADPSFELLRLS